ncbi:unnamed protein product, partial [Mesorhabditis spiculigera]
MTRYFLARITSSKNWTSDAILRVMLLVLLLCLATLAVEAQGDDDICAICTRSGSECIEPDGRTPYCGGPLWPQDRKKRNALVKPPVRCVLPNVRCHDTCIRIHSPCPRG